MGLVLAVVGWKGQRPGFETQNSQLLNLASQFV